MKITKPVPAHIPTGYRVQGTHRLEPSSSRFHRFSWFSSRFGGRWGHVFPTGAVLSMAIRYSFLSGHTSHTVINCIPIRWCSICTLWPSPNRFEVSYFKLENQKSLEITSFENHSRKTVFLLALAAAARVCEMLTLDVTQVQFELAVSTWFCGLRTILGFHRK